MTSRHRWALTMDCSWRRSRSPMRRACFVIAARPWIDAGRVLRSGDKRATAAAGWPGGRHPRFLSKVIIASDPVSGKASHAPTTLASMVASHDDDDCTIMAADLRNLAGSTTLEQSAPR